jgi:hypothetical protein
MRFLWAFILLFGLCSANMPSKALVVSDTTHALSKTKKKVSYTELKTALEKQKGKKLNFTEKIATKILVKKLNKTQKKPIHPDSKWAFWFGLLGYLFMPLTIVLSIFAVIHGIKAIKKTGKNKEFRGRGLAIIGLILGGIPLLILLGVVICFAMPLFFGISICF